MAPIFQQTAQGWGREMKPGNFRLRDEVWKTEWWKGSVIQRVAVTFILGYTVEV